MSSDHEHLKRLEKLAYEVDRIFRHAKVLHNALRDELRAMRAHERADAAIPQPAMTKKPKRPKREDAAQSAFRALQHVIETTEGPSAKPPKKAPRKAR
jgi:hypothetical protein